MNIIETILTGLSLSMDAFMVSVCNGMNKKKETKGLFLIITFGLFQAIMPIIGYYIGKEFNNKIIYYNPFISSVLLIVIGILLYKEENTDIKLSLSYLEILLLGIATSIDALVVGISLAFLKNNIYTSSLIIGIITLILSAIGYYLGNYLNKKLSRYSNKIGGITLIIIAIKIVLGIIL